MTMLHGITAKTLRDQRYGLLAWTAGLAALVGMYVAIWPSIRDQPSMRDMLDQLPKAMRALFAASGADLSTPVGYVQVELLAFMGPMLLLIYAITTGAAAIAGEEEHRTTDLLLSCPVSRDRIVLRKALAMAAGIAGLSTVMGLSLIGEGALAGMRLPVGNVVASMVHLGLLGLVFGSLALAVGAGTGRATASRAVPAVVAVLGYVLNGLGSIISWLEPARRFSPFYQYIGHDPLRTGYSPAALLIAASTALGLIVVAVQLFRRRDIGR